MKKNSIRTSLLLTGIVVMAACGDGEQNSQGTSVKRIEKQPETEVVNEPKGKQLIAQSDCMACHKEKSKLIGPSYAEIALKYPATPENIRYLAEATIKGGFGVWGDVSMTAHPQLSMEAAEEMMKYILTVTK